MLQYSYLYFIHTYTLICINMAEISWDWFKQKSPEEKAEQEDKIQEAQPEMEKNQLTAKRISNEWGLVHQIEQVESDDFLERNLWVFDDPEQEIDLWETDESLTFDKLMTSFSLFVTRLNYTETWEKVHKKLLKM